MHQADRSIDWTSDERPLSRQQLVQHRLEEEA